MVTTPSPAPLPRVGLYRTWRDQGGGQAYERDLEQALSSDFEVHIQDIFPRRLKALPGRRIRQILNATQDPHCDVIIRGFLQTVSLGLRGAGGRQVVLIHHLDHSEVSNTGVSSLLERLFHNALSRAHRLVVVSPFWKKHFSTLVPNLPIDVIYNGFDVDGYAITPEARSAARKRFEFDDRPVVYLGNCQRAKGVVEAYETLKHLPYQLVTSGRREVELPCTHLDVNTEQYRHLLAAADVVLAVSRFLEGWNRTAHEALLAGTPVVGKPMGGLGDLLSGASQITISGPTELPSAVKKALQDREALANRGLEFARGFTLARFNESWQRVALEEARKNAV